MGKTRRARILQDIKKWAKVLASRRSIPVLKGTLSYVIALALIFTRKYDNLSKYPPALTAMIIITIAGGPGKSFGACLQGGGLAMGGVLIGSAFFAILAKLGHVPVAQAVIFALFVYVMSVIRTFGQKYFVISLLAILMAFNGIYTSQLLGTFSPTYLLEYLKGYAWGVAIVLAVNILVFPRTSERELRQSIVTSLEHIATFAVLIGKAYTLKGTPEDKAARELLSQTIKADFTFMTQKIDETSVEVNWSKFSMHDYERFTDRIRQLQRTLLTAHTSLQRFDEKDVDVFRDDILPVTRLPFMKLRKDIDLTIREIGGALGSGPMFIAETQSGYLECLDQQRAATVAAIPPTRQRPNTIKTTSNDEGEKSHPADAEPVAAEPVAAEPVEIETPDDDQPDDVEAKLRSVTQRLQREMGAETPGNALDDTRPSTPTQTHPTLVDSTTVNTPGASKGSPISPKSPLPTSSAAAQSGSTGDKSSEDKPSQDKLKPKYGPSMIKAHFDEFEAKQKDILVQLLTTADAPDENSSLKINEPGPSISELYGGDYLRGNVQEGDLSSAWEKSRKSAASTPKPSKPESPVDVALADDEDDEDEKKQRRSGKGLAYDNEDVDEDSIGPTEQFKRNETLVRVYSLLFAWDTFVETLSALHAETQIKRRRGLHIHVFESMTRPGKKAMPDIGLSEEDEQLLQQEARELSIKEALALLENKPYTPEPVTWMQKLAKINKWFSSDTSVFAIKSAAAASVFATLLFANTTKQWFINYSLTGGLLTCVVALAPTLGQSLLTFILQVGGSGFGVLVGWAILQMFKNVGGYSYNPYGMVAIVGIFAVPLQIFIYEKPQLFVLSLLALNSAASILVIEDLYVNYYGRKTFDTPALRAGKQMTALAIALGIVIIFQLFILRKPARSTLRKKLGELVYANLAYNTILQAYVRAMLPANPQHRGKPVVLRRIERELKHRETKLQVQIIELYPLLAFAAAEPSFGKPFRGDIAQTIIQANQIVLDRLREGRAAIGAEPFDPFILENLVTTLSPYRRRATRIAKTGLYLCAMSLMSKSPLPHDSVLTQHLLNHFVHDALLISSRLTRTEEGQKAIRSDSFVRYWFYLICVSGLPTQLRRVESACKELFGELEDDPRIQ